ncbi:MAG: hypothetical protein J6N70_05155 [Oribacterium sp.]|nr:hypothetical protein [Oribacterium sp.]
MNFEEFKEKIKEDLGSALEAQDIKADISEHHVEKLNSSYDALSVTPEGSNIGVNANLSSMFDAIENGQDYSEVLEMSVNKIAEGIKNAPNVDVQDLTNYEVMKNKLSMDVVSADRNAEMLSHIPHEKIEDMAVVYRLVLDTKDSGNGTILVTNNLMDQFGVTQEQLHEDAMINAPEIRPSEIKGMSEMLSEMMGVDMDPGMDSLDDKMFVATVPDKIHGAGVIAYPNFFEDAAEKIGGDYFVLPSSIHEVLLVKDNGEMTAKDLEAMVREVNATQVSPEEQLTDNVYHYDSKNHVFEMADKFEERQAVKDTKERDGDKESLISDLKAKKEEAAKDKSEKHAKDTVKKSRGGEAL